MADDPRHPRATSADDATRTSWERGRAEPAPEPLFPPGLELGPRYTITRLIARGGMGEVYEAFDRELHERVALKTIRPELAGSAATAERFRREIQLARKVTHPNVCRLHDLGTAEGPRGAVTFLTMELLEGESLAERLRREGAMDAATALPIARQIAAGLDAAHRAGVIHRDFKSGNVLLVADGPGLRAVVTDFGLSRRVDTGEDAGLTQLGGALVGTPAYMAPEQIEGLELTPAADIYALGIVLYEMRTGRLPFSGATPMSVALQRLKIEPPTPRALNATIEPEWEHAILRCLAREPAERFAGADEVVAALEGELPPRGALRARARAPRRTGPAVALVIALTALAVLASIFFWRSREPTTPATTARPAATRRPVVAVLGFKNSTARAADDWLATALAEMVTTELAAGERVRTVPGEVVARARQGLGLLPADSLAADTLERLRGQLAADYVVVGAYTALGEGSARQVRFDLRLQDAASGEVLAAVAETGAESALFDLVGRAGGKLRAGIGLGSEASAGPAASRAVLPADPAAARLYAEGLERTRAGDLLGARERLEGAARIEPGFPLVHAALAEVWSALGYDQRARDTAARAASLAANLPREARLWIEARQAESAREFGRASEAYGALFGFYPDNLDYGLRLARAQVNGGRVNDALRTVESLRVIAPAAGDPRIELMEAIAAGKMADYRRAADGAQRAAAQADGDGARLIAADARGQQGWALQRLGEPESALELFAEARRTYAELGQKAGAARMTMLRGQALANKGDRDGARRSFEEALATFREIGDQRSIGTVRNDLGNLLYDQGDLAGARRYYEQAAATNRETGNTTGLAGALGNIANILDNTGDLEGARRLHEEAIGLFRAAGDQGGVARSVFNLGLVLAEQGRLGEARQRYEEALAMHRTSGYRRGVGFTTASLGDIALAQDELPQARRHYEESLAVREELGEKLNVEVTRLLLATLALEEGQPRQALELARAAGAVFAHEEQADLESSALVAQARALLAQRQPREALAAAKRAVELAASTQNQSPKLDAAIALARAQSANGDENAARRGLATALAQATRYGLVPQQLEARLAQAELDPRAAGALADDARAAGFLLLARKAAALNEPR